MSVHTSLLNNNIRVSIAKIKIFVNGFFPKESQVVVSAVGKVYTGAKGDDFMKRCVSAVLALVLAALFTGCVGNARTLPGTLGVTLRDSTISEHWDDHGGMSDGTQYWKVDLSQEDAAALEQTAQTREGWHTFPLTEDAEALLYGREWTEGSEERGAGPYLTGKDGKALLPQVEEGYWFFWDDQTRSPETTGVLGRGSYNFTAAVYDSTTHTLYCGELDT